MQIKVEAALKLIERELPPQHYNTLFGILRWADIWDTMHASEKLEPSQNNIAALLSPFSGFGSHDVWQVLSPGITFLVMHEVQKWMSMLETERASMVETLLVEIAPAMANIAHGPDAYRRTFGILRGALK